MTVVLVVLGVFLPTVLRFPAPTSRKSRDVGHPICFRFGLEVHRSFVGSRSLSRVTPLPQDDSGSGGSWGLPADSLAVPGTHISKTARCGAPAPDSFSIRARGAEILRWESLAFASDSAASG